MHKNPFAIKSDMLTLSTVAKIKKENTATTAGKKR